MTKSLINFFNILSGFRKFIVMVVLIIVGIVFRVADLLNGAEFVNLLSGTVIAFFSANTVEHFTSIAKDWIASKAEPVAKPAPAPAPTPSAVVDNPDKAGG